MKNCFNIYIILILTTTQIFADPGLNNVGNSCFFNATMQALAHVKSFRNKINQIQETDISSVKDEAEKNFAKEFVRLINTMTSQKDGNINPSATYNAMINVAKERSKGSQKYLVGRDETPAKAYDQHDPAEVLDLLLFKTFGESGCKVLTDALDTFAIKLISETKRSACGHITTSEDVGHGRNWIEFDMVKYTIDPESFEQKIEKLESADLINFCNHLFIEGETRSLRCDWCTAERWIKEGKLNKNNIGETIFDAISENIYTAGLNSQIAENKAYKDLVLEANKKDAKIKFIERQASRTKKFNTIPTAIIFDFKRFLQTATGARGEKLNTKLSFPETLDILPYISSSLKSKLTQPTKVIYKLKSFICHSGDLGGGHHYAYGWSNSDNCWYKLSDSSVSKKVNISAVTQNNNAPFILFYELNDESQEILREDGLLQQPQLANSINQQLAKLKTSLKELKIKLQTLQEKLNKLKSNI